MLAAARNAVDSLGSELVFACTKLEQTKLLREVVSVSNMGKRALKARTQSRIERMRTYSINDLLERVIKRILLSVIRESGL